MSQPSTPTRDVLKQVVGGGYRERYLIYCRKSTDDIDNQKNSITYQKLENGRFAARAALPIAALTLDGFCTNGIVSERHSGFKEDAELTFGEDNTVQYRVDRPKFHRLAQWLSRGYFKGAIFLCWDRASRNKGDDTLLRKLMKAGVDIHFALARYDKTSAGALHMDIDGMFAEHHSRVTSEKVTITMRNARSRGLCTHKAPVGYLNPGSMAHKPHDPVRAPIIRQLFTLAASGEWSLADLARWAIEQGFTMPPQRRRRTEAEILADEEDDVRLDIVPIAHLPTFNSIHKILINPTYTGKTLNEDGVWAPSASLEPIVSDALFDTVQSQLRRRNKSARYATLVDLPLRRILHCGACGRVYTPYSQKGITYYGVRCRPGCANPLKNINFGGIAAKVGGLIRNLSFTDDELAEIDARATSDIALLDGQRMDRLEKRERRKKQLREELRYLDANRLPLLRAGAYTPDGIVAEATRLNGELTSLNEAEDVSDASMRETVADAIALSELLKDGADFYDLANPQEKDTITRIIFSELTLTGNRLDYRCKNGFLALQCRFVASGDPMGWISELILYRDDIEYSISTLAGIR